MATYDLKFDLLNFFSLQNNNKTLAVYITGDEAQIDKRWKQGETFTLGWFRKPMKDFTLTDNGISGTTYGWSDSPVTSIRTHQEGGSDNQPYHYYDNFTVGSNGNDDYRICLYFGLDNNNLPSLRVLVYNVSTGSYPYNGSNSYFNSPQKSEGLLYWSMGSGYLGGLTLNVTLNEGIHIPVSYGTTYACVCELCTNIPVFDTYAHAKDYCETLSTEGLLNIAGDPREEYKKDQMYYYLHNIFTHDYHGTKSSAWYNYRWKPGYGSKIRLHRVKPSQSRYYTLVLTVPGGLTRFKGPKGEYNDDDAFVVDEDDLQTHFQEYSYLISRVAPRDEVTVSDFDTNIPIWGSAEDATKYANDELSIEDALNYSDILAYEQQLPEPDFGDVDVETETGINGQTYAAGSSIYVMSRSEMIAFFTEIFRIQDPTFINAFKDGNVLFGDNQANAIIGCQYFPFDASLVCSLESSSGSIWVGGWESQNATGKKVNYNDKTITVGEFFLPDMFKDVRDYEPYTNIYVQLPYCGTYQLSVQKYINKTVKIEYAVDIFTGACTALLYANNILMDSMDGMIGSQRPVTGRTAANMLQAITRGSASVAAGAAGGIKMGGIAASIGGELSGAYLPAFGANVGGGAMFGAAHAVAGGTVLAAGGAGLLAAGAAGAGAVAGVDMMYKAKNAYADPPMASRGQYSGNLGMFANQKVHFIVAIRHNYRPENELNLIGYPSGRGGIIGNFSGFLKSSCVYLADGFIGSVQERNEILEMIAKGIYI